MTAPLDPSLDVRQHWGRGRRLARHVWEHFQEDRCFAEAASLGYTSLLSMVPLLAVVFGIISVFPVFDQWSSRLQQLIFDHFLPASGQQIVPYIDAFLSGVSNLTLPGTLMLFVTALLLMMRIEAAFNHIWRVDHNRTLVNRIVMYWALLTLGPLLIMAGLALSAQRMFGDHGFFVGLPPFVQGLGSFALSWLMFALFFVIVPNRPVRLRHALAGAFLTAVLFTLAKTGFVAYVSHTSYNVIYGALATVPLFLFWLYVVWTVILLGASLAASLTTFSDSAKLHSQWPRRWEFQLAYRLLGHLGDAQTVGKALSREALFELEPLSGETQLVRLLSQLREARFVSRDENGDWLLARDLDALSLGELYDRGDYPLPLDELDRLRQDTARDRAYVQSLQKIRDRSIDVWNTPLSTLYQQDASDEDPA